ncbi:MAG TPA: phosphatase PAP2 family protein [Flavihumibacter sp.]|jgi:membrane-associated phospholipid phosphatase
MEFFHRLIELDKKLLILINGHWHTPGLDFLFQHIRETVFWVPLYLFFIVLALTNFGKKGGWWILFAVCTVAITDQVSSNLIKNNIIRLRPCRDMELIDQVRFFVQYCPRSSSFTSSHATNHFGLAAFICFSLRNHIGTWIYVLFGFAALVSYAQVYVGVHYPLDILAGGLLGTFLGYGMSSIFNKNIGLPQPATV